MSISSKPVIYLAGPEVFLPDAQRNLEESRALCEKYGFSALTPFDREVEKGATGLDLARSIYRNNRALIEKSDIVVANCNSFRGAVVDDGTSWEIGYAAGHGKRIYGFIRNRLTLPEIVATRIDLTDHPSGYPVDMDGFLVNEDFGNSINLMLEMSIEESGGILVQGSLEDALRQMRKDILKEF